MYTAVGTHFYIGIDSINWTLVSSITQLNNAQYRIDCITADTNSSTDVYWLVNGVMKNNSMYESTDDDLTNNTLLVYPDPLGVSVTVTCTTMFEGITYSEYVTLNRMIVIQSMIHLYIVFSYSS